MNDPTDVAERATLGALLAQPRQLDTVAGWLRPSDFAHWWHTEIYRALLRAPGLARLGDPVATAEHVRRVLVETLDHPRADPPALHTLLRDAPARPVAARYAAMVLEASIRRQTAGLAVHLLAAAVPDPAASGAQRPEPSGESRELPQSLREVTGLVGPVIADLGTQWAAAVRALQDATGHPRDQGAPGRTGAAGTGTPLGVSVGLVDAAADQRRTTRQRELAVISDRAVRTGPDRDPADARRAQHQLIAALVSHPDRIEAVAAWLRPEHVAGPTRAVYEALLALHQDTSPIDPVTVAWEIHRASRGRGPGPDPRDLLARIEAAALLDVHQLTATVARDTLRRTAAHTADGLRAAAANPGLTVGDVLDAASWAADAVTRAAADIAATPVGIDPVAGNPRAAGARDVDGPAEPASGGRWRRARHLTPVADGPDLSVVR